MITRRGFLRWLAGLALATGAVGGYAGAVEPGLRLVLRRWQIAPPGWPRSLRMRIAMVADPHMGGPQMPLSRLERIVARTQSLGADLIVLPGDFEATHRFVLDPVPIEATARVLARLSAPLGVYAVLGNHDWWFDAEAQRRGGGPTRIGQALEAAGLPVLENRALRLVHRGQAFWLLGLGDQLALRGRGGFTGVDDLPGTLAQVTDDAPAILLAHEPDIFPRVPDRIALTLSGHTHGGQIRILGYSPVVPSRFGNRFAWGHVREGGRDLVVSGGLGCSIVPVRLGMPPEITVVDIGGADT